LKAQDHGVDFAIEPGRGDVSVVPQQRTYRLIFHRVLQPAEVTVHVNDAPREVTTRYDEGSQRFTLEVIATPRDRVEITVRRIDQSWIARDDRRKQRCLQMLRTFRMESDRKQEIDERLADIFDDPALLKSLGAGVKDVHIAALSSVIESEEL
jgi:hypothetical protein